mmetsp:Transcript_54455/g.133095  ORF Transcript_54455/g.133095 Transcript_54455/m.133095 type:complete len:258 (-) Transcript_54455:1916-2689(-)
MASVQRLVAHDRSPESIPQLVVRDRLRLGLGPDLGLVRSRSHTVFRFRRITLPHLSVLSSLALPKIEMKQQEGDLISRQLLKVGSLEVVQRLHNGNRPDKLLKTVLLIHAAIHLEERKACKEQPIQLAVVDLVSHAKLLKSLNKHLPLGGHRHCKSARESALTDTASLPKRSQGFDRLLLHTSDRCPVPALFRDVLHELALDAPSVAVQQPLKKRPAVLGLGQFGHPVQQQCTKHEDRHADDDESREYHTPDPFKVS